MGWPFGQPGRHTGNEGVQMQPVSEPGPPVDPREPNALQCQRSATEEKLEREIERMGLRNLKNEVE